MDGLFYSFQQYFSRINDGWMIMDGFYGIKIQSLFWSSLQEVILYSAAAELGRRHDLIGPLHF